MRSRLEVRKATNTRLRILTWDYKVHEEVIEAYRKHLREDEKHPERFVSQARQAALDWGEPQVDYHGNLEVREYSSVATMQGVIVKDTWAMIELIPYATVTTDRPALALTPKTDAELFALLAGRFERLWADSRRLA
jgi:hypothetical protein